MRHQSHPPPSYILNQNLGVILKTFSPSPHIKSICKSLSLFPICVWCWDGPQGLVHARQATGPLATAPALYTVLISIFKPTGNRPAHFSPAPLLRPLSASGLDHSSRVQTVNLLPLSVFPLILAEALEQVLLLLFVLEQKPSLCTCNPLSSVLCRTKPTRSQSPVFSLSTLEH